MPFKIKMVKYINSLQTLTINLVSPSYTFLTSSYTDCLVLKTVQIVIL